ncbi:MmgE/PrpD family protein [Bordetella genomosp. 13]|uniref:MmgE/PrpD family protein n=1 Tax=Bordetella genomosp. 13 TaxID=463040 RepID=A0A1W6ZD03_9BORD|nr:MmgE/PrpD family protein [Bordetella genomosp. 13]ARP95209.1 hypothetical protein CAL15_12940 [Bordetella genomosp. 13]
MDISDTQASRIVREALRATPDTFGADALAHARRCLLDYLSCAFEALPLPWSTQAAGLADPAATGAHVVGRAAPRALAQAAFANAVAGHGLVREDMHAGSVAHLGVVVWPTVLALSERHAVSGAQALAAAVVGYETGARIGRAVITRELARLFRPTGLVGPFAAAMAGARVMGLDEAQALHAFALAGNCCAGLNQWAYTGGSEMYFHPGFVVRNALACLDLARLGAQASASILEGEAGFFQAYARAPLADPIRLFADGKAEIAQVFNKPAPACNFAQTPCQAALRALGRVPKGRRITAVRIETTHAAVAYPGCASAGPFEHALQAKMSILYGVAAVLARGAIEEDNYRRLDDPEIARLVDATTLARDEAFTRAFPARQGARVALALDDGSTVQAELDDVAAAGDALIRERFRRAASQVLGAERALRIEQMVDGYEHEPDAGALARLCAAPAHHTTPGMEITTP